MGWNLSTPFTSPAIVMASSVLSCPSGGTRHTAAISFTASRDTWGWVGSIDLDKFSFYIFNFKTIIYLASKMRASLWLKRFWSPTLLFMIAFRHLIHS